MEILLSFFRLSYSSSSMDIQFQVPSNLGSIALRRALSIIFTLLSAIVKGRCSARPGFGMYVRLRFGYLNSPFTKSSLAFSNQASLIPLSVSGVTPGVIIPGRDLSCTQAAFKFAEEIASLKKLVLSLL